MGARSGASWENNCPRIVFQGFWRSTSYACSAFCVVPLRIRPALGELFASCGGGVRALWYPHGRLLGAKGSQGQFDCPMRTLKEILIIRARVGTQEFVGLTKRIYFPKNICDQRGKGFPENIPDRNLPFIYK